MAWNTDQILNCYLYLIRKNQADSVSPQDFFFNWNLESRAYYADLRGRFNRNNNSKTGIDTGLAENQVIITTLSPLMHNITIPVVSGQAAKPANFSYLMAMRDTNTQDRTYSFNKDQKFSIVGSVIDPPSVADSSFYYTEYGTYFEVLPANTVSVDLDYLSSPVDIVWGYTIDPTTNRFVYDTESSVQSEWSQTSIDEITKRSLKSTGVSFQNEDYAQYGESIITKGD